MHDEYLIPLIIINAKKTIFVDFAIFLTRNSAFDYHKNEVHV